MKGRGYIQWEKDTMASGRSETGNQRIVASEECMQSDRMRHPPG